MSRKAGLNNVRNRIIRRDRRDNRNNNRKPHSMGDSRNSRQDKWAMIYSLFEYMNTHIMSIKQRNKAKYPEYEYRHTHNTSIAGELIRAQAEQIRRITAEEYIKGKCIKMCDGSRH